MAASALSTGGGTPIVHDRRGPHRRGARRPPVDPSNVSDRPDDPRRQYQHGRHLADAGANDGMARLGLRAGRGGSGAGHAGERSRRHLLQHDHDDADAGRLRKDHDERSLHADRAHRRDPCCPRRRARHAGGGGEPPQIRALARHQGPVPALRHAPGPDRLRRCAPAQPPRATADRPPAGTGPRHGAHRRHRVRVRPTARDRHVAEAPAP